MVGLLSRDGPPDPRYLDVVDGFVVQAHWRDLQPTTDDRLADDNVIDRAIAEVRRLNTTRASGARLALKLRVYTGVYAPDWVKAIGGPPVVVSDADSGVTDTVGRFWTRQFGDAYARLQQLLAGRYDAVAEIRETVISRCTLFSAEPFIREKGDPPTTQHLLAAGYSTAADHRCHSEEIAAHDVWRRTRSDLALNPYQDIERHGRDSVDLTFTVEMMQSCRVRLGERCVLENNSAATPPKYPDMYRVMDEMGAPLAFQTASPARVGDLFATLDWIASTGAASAELPRSYVDHSPADYGSVADRLRDNA